MQVQMVGAFTVLLVGAACLGQTSAPQTPGPERDFEQEVSFVRSIANQANAKDAAAQLAPILEKWRKLSVESYARLTLETCVVLKSGFQKNIEKTDLADTFAIEALTEKSLPPDVALRLAVGLSPIPSEIKPDAYATKRTERMNLLMSCWKNINDALDPHFDPEKRPMLEINPPLAMRGQPPDETAMANYRATRQKNFDYSKYYGLQTRLRETLQTSSRQWRAGLTQMYSSGPDGADELSAALRSNVTDEKEREQILKEVRDVRAKGSGK